jgi:hypothetical protein
MRDISGNGDQEGWGLTACLKSKQSYREGGGPNAVAIDVCQSTHLESGGSRRTALRVVSLASLI